MSENKDEKDRLARLASNEAAAERMGGRRTLVVYELPEGGFAVTASFGSISGDEVYAKATGIIASVARSFQHTMKQLVPAVSLEDIRRDLLAGTLAEWDGSKMAHGSFVRLRRGDDDLPTCDPAES